MVNPFVNGFPVRRLWRLVQLWHDNLDLRAVDPLGVELVIRLYKTYTVDMFRYIYDPWFCYLCPHDAESHICTYLRWPLCHAKGGRALCSRLSWTCAFGLTLCSHPWCRSNATELPRKAKLLSAIIICSVTIPSPWGQWWLGAGSWKCQLPPNTPRAWTIRNIPKVPGTLGSQCFSTQPASTGPAAPAEATEQTR